MESLKSLYWNQGLFLKPQHFQQLELQATSVANAFSKIRTGINCGLSKLKIDENALKTNMLVITELECVLSDGTLLIFPGNCTLTPVKLDTSNADTLGHISVSIAVSPLLEQASNLTRNNEAIARYQLNDNVVKKDLFDPQESADLTTLDYDCRILLGDQQLKQHNQLICFKVAELMSVGNEYQQDTKFIPQVLTIASSKVLQGYIKSLKQSLMGRFEQLESFNSVNVQAADSSNHNVGMLMTLNTLASYIAIFSHFAEMNQSRPADLYLSIRQLIAQLSVFSKTISVNGETNNNEYSLVPFNEQNLTECFYRATCLTSQLLNELTVDPELLITLVSQGDAKYVAPLTSEFVDGDNRVYLRLRTTNNLEEQLDDLLNYAKLGADGQVDVYLKRSLPGVELSYLSRKPQGIASMTNSYYFVFDRESFQWQKVVELNRLGLIWNNAPKDLIVDLIAVKG